MTFNQSLLRPVAVTIAALALYRLGQYIPLPGINHEALDTALGTSAMSNALNRVSILGLGIVPWFSALALVEFAILLFRHRAQLFIR